jgi:hydrogenase expression/formation protein HypC
MCLGVPGEVLSVGVDETRTGRVSFGGVVKNICLIFVPEAVPGDYVVVHAGFAISKVDAAAAARTWAVLAELEGE